MKAITPILTPELEQKVNPSNVSGSPPVPVDSYRELVEHVAKLAFRNPDQLLFFRGQETDYLNKAGRSTFYPSIYRDDPLAGREVRRRFDLLGAYERQLVEQFGIASLDGHADLARKQYVRWSILQHYEVCSTPLLDFTHSIRVACSFAQSGNAFVSYAYVFGLPYISNRISINSEQDLVNVRLLSISPPAALRPYFQDGYLAGTTDLTFEYENKTEFDFNRRVIAKFELPNESAFWGNGFSKVPTSVLFPTNDRVKQLCDEIRDVVREEVAPAEIGEFLGSWVGLEERLLRYVRQEDARVVSVRDATRRLQQRGRISPELAVAIDKIRRFRNTLVHSPHHVEPGEVERWIAFIEETMEEMRRVDL